MSDCTIVDSYRNWFNLQPMQIQILCSPFSSRTLPYFSSHDQATSFYDNDIYLSITSQNLFFIHTSPVNIEFATSFLMVYWVNCVLFRFWCSQLPAIYSCYQPKCFAYRNTWLTHCHRRSVCFPLCFQPAVWIRVCCNTRIHPKVGASAFFIWFVHLP